jgi:hypothetical protein
VDLRGRTVGPERLRDAEQVGTRHQTGFPAVAVALDLRTGRRTNMFIAPT